MEWSGVALLLLVAVGVIGTGLPAAVVLIMAASAGALLGVVSNIIPASLLWALPGRLINLLEIAARRSALSREQCSAATQSFGSIGIGHGTGRIAWADEWFSRCQRNGIVAGDFTST